LFIYSVVVVVVLLVCFIHMKMLAQRVLIVCY
jgi:hypothetical protein